ncbi:catechol 2,3-dioxygenase-like lactoylglutathione lyase family enzyme [Lacibacter cauensis]|uniref:Catechol 2,3-dioxygenase-like lactoylglutathione lyase family enzyme n=1 Tax=Lacibacter cauensis TaxID=510947 RepID=A0A562SRW4_9BACT|nr:VOC family protein [Lacibacter cauensis]TWI83873.1 catechol 2,3-dioxygenase-like lactoylglutathione lyase family enzyme [Lacibacter cauensis]
MFQKISIAFFALLLTGSAFAQTDAKIEVVKHNHVALHVKDIAASTKFYRDVMGLEPVAVPDSLKAIRSWFKLGADQQIHLLAGRDFEVKNDRNGSHFALFVTSIAAVEKYLTQHKMSFHKQVRFDGAVQIYVADPDGYLIELNEVKR